MTEPIVDFQRVSKLVLTCRPDEMIRLGENIFVYVYREVRYDKEDLRIAIHAPKDVQIRRLPLT